jgi:hypothetical protein
LDSTSESRAASCGYLDESKTGIVDSLYIVKPTTCKVVFSIMEKIENGSRLESACQPGSKAQLVLTLFEANVGA